MSELVIYLQDTVGGLPARGIPVQLCRLGTAQQTHLLGITKTGKDGCARFVLPTDEGAAVSRFQAMIEPESSDSSIRAPSFFPEICIEFLWSGTEKLVIPVLLSPHGFSVYRGS